MIFCAVLEWNHLGWYGVSLHGYAGKQSKLSVINMMLTMDCEPRGNLGSSMRTNTEAESRNGSWGFFFSVPISSIRVFSVTEVIVAYKCINMVI